MVHSAYENAGRPLLQLGLTGVSYWSLEDPFINHLHCGSGWDLRAGKSVKRKVTKEQLTFNKYGMPYVPDGYGASDSTVHTAPFFGKSDEPGASEQYKGRWIVDWQGKAVIRPTIWKNVKIVTQSANKIVLDVTGPTQITFILKESSPSFRNFRFYRQSEQKDLASGKIFSRRFLNRVSKYDCLRFMDWLKINHSTTSEPEHMNDEAHLFWGGEETNLGRRGTPLSVCLKLAAETNTIPWVNLPHQASTRLVDFYADQINKHVPNGKIVIVEYSNEIWNWAFKAQTGYAQARGKLLAPNIRHGMRYFYGYHSAKLLMRLREKCPNHTVVGNIATQANYFSSKPAIGQAWQGRALITGQALHGVVDYLKKNKSKLQPHHLFDVGITTYFFPDTSNKKLGGYTNEELVQRIKSDPQGLMRHFRDQFLKGPQKANVASLEGMKQIFAIQMETANAMKMDVVTYEGGSHFTMPYTLWSNEDAMGWYAEYVKSDYMVEQLEKVQKAAVDAGVMMLSDFGNVSAVSKYGPWGTIDNYANEGSALDRVWDQYRRR